MMNEALDLLLAEDSESDAALVARLLEKAGYDVHGSGSKLRTKCAPRLTGGIGASSSRTIKWANSMRPPRCESCASPGGTFRLSSFRATLARNWPWP